MILHLALVRDWNEARATGTYPWSTRGLTLEQVGYVHCSREHQWRGVRERFYSDLSADELVLLEIDETLLSSPVVDEQLDGAPDSFPHIYGPLEPAAVVGERRVD